jgi:hypothetical protein
MPMGGFLRRAGEGEPSAFEVVLNSASARLDQIESGAGSPVAWFSVAENLQKVAGGKPLQERFYRGGQSRLDQALAQIERTLASGETEAALVVTDLIVTGEVVGAQGAAQKLRDFTRSAEVRSGRLHLGLLGVKADYRGVRPASCRPKGKAGCRFSELQKSWLPLDENTLAPFYVLVFARGRDQVEKVLAGFAKELADHDFDTESEILSAASQPRQPEPTECSIETEADPGRRQYALSSDREAMFHCSRSEKLLISCRLPPEPRSLAVEPASPEKWLEYSLSGERFELALDCAENRDSKFPVALEFTARNGGDGAEKWSEWSTTSDDRQEDAGRTLRLEEFLEKVRLAPAAYRVALKLWPPGKTK